MQIGWAGESPIAQSPPCDLFSRPHRLDDFCLRPSVSSSELGFKFDPTRVHDWICVPEEDSTRVKEESLTLK